MNFMVFIPRKSIHFDVLIAGMKLAAGAGLLLAAIIEIYFLLWVISI